MLYLKNWGLLNFDLQKIMFVEVSYVMIKGDEMMKWEQQNTAACLQFAKDHMDKPEGH